MNRPKVQTRRALISVSDKTGLIPFARALTNLSFEIISTGGTAQTLRDADIAVIEVSELTDFPEIMDGRVKTLHPAVHGGLLARAGTDEEVTARLGIGWIDLLVVNLYPFESTVAQSGCTVEQAVENIDVGGPAMLRAAAKNHSRLTVVIDPDDYGRVLAALEKGDPPADLKRELATKTFSHTARYDAAISDYLAQAYSNEPFPETLVLAWHRVDDLRYGENPHQKAAVYRLPGDGLAGVAAATQIQGKPLSFNNLADADAALQCVRALDACGCVIVKHANPCGVAIAATPLEAYKKAYSTDPTSAFGGVIAFNNTLDAGTADAIIAQQLVDVIVALAVDVEARRILEKKKNIRVLEAGPSATSTGRVAVWDLRSLEGGLLVQERDLAGVGDIELRVATKRAPSETELNELRFAWTITKYVKSNAIVFTRDGRTLGVGAGQMSRVISARVAAMKAADEELELAGAAMASDAFFPFRDGIDIAAEYGIGCVIQPGGSVRDDEVIQAADEHDMAMVLTGVRHFRH